jgi:UDP-3-O-[3-hydroxymyristoyl] glucosamine N-acyltransferase
MRLGELAELLGARLLGDPDLEITGLGPIDEAGPGELTFIANPRYRPMLGTTNAAAVILAESEESHIASPKAAVLLVKEPYGAFVRALSVFDQRPRPEVGIHATAVIAATAIIGEGAYIGPYAVVGDNVTIGRDARIHPHVVLYPEVRVGDRFTAHAGAVVRECVIFGDDVVLQPGAVIGADGFGFLPTGDRPTAIPQIGTVQFGDGVEVGANSAVDRAAVGVTRLSDGVKLDNLVQVAHGCRIGAGSMLASQTGLAGSTTIGRRVLTGGQVGTAGHLTVGDGVQIAGRAGVLADVEAGKTVSGMPAIEISTWRRMVVALPRLPELFRRVRALEKAREGES